MSMGALVVNHGGGAHPHAMRRLGKYQILAQLGRGGMAEVFLAVAEGPSGFRKLLVLKTLRTGLESSAEFTDMFMDEARLAARLNHPNVIQTYEFGHDEEELYLVMEYLEGCTFGELRKVSRASDTTLPLGTSMRVLIEALTGLHYAHELRDFDDAPLGLVHRDVSAQNILMTFQGQIKVLDFGIAKARSSITKTRSGVLKGTIRYTSPEGFLGVHVDRRADIYSVGVLIWEAITGQSMWKGLSDAAIMHHVTTGKFVKPSDVCSDVNPELETICMKALAQDREDRFANAGELQEALEALSGQIDIPSAREVGSLAKSLVGKRAEKIKEHVNKQLAALEQSGSGAVQGMSSPFKVLAIPSVADVRSGNDDETRDIRGTSTRRARTELISPKKKPRLQQLGIAAAIATALVVGLWTMYGNSTQKIGTVQAAERTPRAQQDRPEMVSIRISATPKTASLYVNDKLVGEGSATLTLPKSNEQGIVRASAPHYATRAVNIGLEKDTSLILTLEKESSASDASVGTQNPVAQASKKQRVQKKKSSRNTRRAQKASGTKKGMRIDTNNPWAD